MYAPTSAKHVLAEAAGASATYLFFSSCSFACTTCNSKCQTNGATQRLTNEGINTTKIQ